MNYEKLIQSLIDRDEPSSIQDAFDVARELETLDAVIVSGGGRREAPTTIYDEGNFKLAHDMNKKIRSAANRMLSAGVDAENMRDLYYRTHLFDAPHFFDNFCIYIEKDREPQKQFYLPRRKQLLPCTEALQDLEEGRLELLGISEPPGVGKTTLAEFFLAWTSGRNPYLPSLVGSHNNAFLGGVYGEMLRILDSNGEYRWSDVFPGLKVVNTNARDMMIGIGASKADDMRFKTLEFTSIGAQNAGKVRAMNVLYCDDLVDGIETAMSIDRLDKLWQAYYTDLRQRKVGTRVKELHIATRWSVHDVIGRLERQYEGDPTARFIRFSALDENDESNFDYPYGLGYSTKALHDQRDIMDEPSWRALFCNEPIEREGLLYEATELRRFFDLPDREPDTILAICDTKEQGADYCVMPVFYQYGTDFYLDTIICDNGKVETVEERVAQKLVDRKVRMCRIESNRGGTMFAQNVQKRVKELGGMTNITTKWTQTNKETRIIANSGMIKSHVLFKDESYYPRDREYRDAMTQLCSYSMVGKNKHDDVPDVLGLFVDWQLSDRINTATLVKRLF